MPSLDDIARSQTSLSGGDVAWLHALVADWQIIADLAFSDLVLWVADAEAKGWWAGAQIRPTTGPTTLLEDVAGTFLPAGQVDLLDEAERAGRAVRGQIVGDDGAALRVEAVPVRRDDRTLAVLARRQGRVDPRQSGRLETAYVEASSELLTMVQRGEFPVPGSRSDVTDSLRVGDGFVRTDVTGQAVYASPNAQSAYRRLGLVGDLVGRDLAEVTAELVDRRPTERAISGLLTGDEIVETDVENAAGSVVLRRIPLRSDGRPDGAVVLLRDVTELRLRERELISKEATIREIHHRVKNNLQTVAALLRLQARRVDVAEAREALEEAVRRVGSIAVVHETLSQSFGDAADFDAIADSLLSSVLDVAGGTIRAERIGSFGLLPGEVATPLAMVLTELIQNAAEHAFDGEGGHLTLAVSRIRGRLGVRVSDDGRGMPPDAGRGSSLGLSIVSTLVESELGGTLTYAPRSPRGTTITLEMSL